MKKHYRIVKMSCPTYPNGASSRYIRQRILDMVTAIASGMGFVTVLVFFLLM